MGLPMIILKEQPNDISRQVLSSPAGITACGSHGHDVPGIIKVGKEEMLSVLFTARNPQGPKLLPNALIEAPVPLQDHLHLGRPLLRLSAQIGRASCRERV